MCVRRSSVPSGCSIKSISTRLDPDALVGRGELRKDLYYFVKGSTLILPSLKERKGDIPLLVEHFVSACAGERDLAVAQDAMSTLCDYDFPGNIPELEAVVKESLAKTTGSALTKAGGDTWFFLTADYAFGHALELLSGYALRHGHHEIYMGDPRRAEPEKDRFLWPNKKSALDEYLAQ